MSPLPIDIMRRLPDEERRHFVRDYFDALQVPGLPRLAEVLRRWQGRAYPHP